MRLSNLLARFQVISHEKTESPEETESSASDFKRAEIKTDSVAKKIFLSLGALIVLTPVLHHIVPLFLNKEFTKKKEYFHEKIEEKRVDAIRGVYDKHKNLTADTNLQNDKHVKALFKELEREPPRSKNVQKLLKKIYESENYQGLKESGHLFVQFLEELAITLRTNVIGMDIFKEYGESILSRQDLNEKDQGYTYEEIGNCLIEAFNNSLSPGFDSTPAKVFHVVQDLKGVANIFGAIGFLRNPVKDFNPYPGGNFNLATMDYSFDDHDIRFFHGPGPGITSDRMLSLQLDALQREGGIHLQHSMEFAQRKGEFERIQQLKAYEDNSKGRMRFYATPVDGEAWHMKGKFKKFTTATDFVDKYLQLAKGGEGEEAKAYKSLPNNRKENSGFYLGGDVMSDDQFEGLFALTAEIFDDDSFDENPYVQEMLAKGDEGKRVLAKGLQVFMQSLISVGALANLSKESEGTLTFGQACTEDIDRGAVMNVSTRLLLMRLSGQEITADELAEITGSIFGRADFSNERRIMKDRFEGLTAFLFLLGNHDQNKLALIKTHLQEHFFAEKSFAIGTKPLS